MVLDIDNTILTSNIDLGSDIWYQWQRSSLEIIPTETQKVDCLFEDAIGLLYELNPLVLTEDNIPNIISTWQNNGNYVIALTSRSPRYRAATERELLNKGIDLSKTAITEHGKTTVVYREQLQREISYMNGIMMTSGMDKGKMLKHLISKVSKLSNESPMFDAITFVDDSLINIQNMHQAYENTSGVELTAIHYTHVEEQRKQNFGAVLTQEQANKMDEDWKSLTTFLNQLFPRRQVGATCIANE
ncbi:uncharacterized protein DUF2608 [Arenicella xantha]|uniref:Uncharacterized protein DUF2608 n=1 Tax=Arenicella xantha TaxID=644221 RepID=A0A395JN79_9GAMM|nr:uncharacterized protein DUF2608 [Arenicella xantha]